MNIPMRKMKEEFNHMMFHISNEFASEAGFQMARAYIKGLFADIERKNGWQTPYAIQQFLYRGRFNPDGLRDRLRDYIGEKLGEDGGVLVVDETGFLKQGKISCGVKRQYSGTAGRVQNCQIGVFLTYASKKGHAAIDRRLYIPQEWFEDKERCAGRGDTGNADIPDQAGNGIGNDTAGNLWRVALYMDHRGLCIWRLQAYRTSILRNSFDVLQV